MDRVSSINFGSNPTRNMGILLRSLTPSGIVPEANKYYTFIYRANTPGIQYDQNPLILCGDVYKWGFNGMNVHWGSVRQYSWSGMVSNIYELDQEEFGFLQDVPLAKFRST